MSAAPPPLPPLPLPNPFPFLPCPLVRLPRAAGFPGPCRVLAAGPAARSKPSAPATTPWRRQRPRGGTRAAETPAGGLGRPPPRWRLWVPWTKAGGAVPGPSGTEGAAATQRAHTHTRTHAPTCLTLYYICVQALNTDCSLCKVNKKSLCRRYFRPPKWPKMTKNGPVLG